jgi:predicted homoserine dehydrogenase-like protein
VILVDSALRKRAAEGRPARIAVVGCGAMGSAIARHVSLAVAGMVVVHVVARNPGRARASLAAIGCPPLNVTTDLDAAVGDPAVDAVVEATGSIDYGAEAVLRAIDHRKPVVLMNAELDGTLGPILRRRADEVGVIYTQSGGDQPGVTMDLWRFVCGLGARPVLCGNIKGLLDRYRTPETQAAYARQWGQNAAMVTSFADGTKLSFEQATIANATGMSVARRGMLGISVPAGTHVDDLPPMFPAEALERRGGVVDYALGATPAPGVFVIARQDDRVDRHYLSLYKLGEGPCYVFHTPSHLCHFEVAASVVRALDFGDAVLAPAAGLRVEVVAVAKRDLHPGDVLDGIGGFSSYGIAENHAVARAERLLPMGLSEGCRVARAVARDEVLRLDDVERPAERLSDRLRLEQDATFGPAPS